MKEIIMAAASWELLKNWRLPDKKNLVETSLDLSEKIISTVIDTAKDVETDCRIKADELFSFFTADVIKKDVVFYNRVNLISCVTYIN